MLSSSDESSKDEIPKKKPKKAKRVVLSSSDDESSEEDKPNAILRAFLGLSSAKSSQEEGETTLVMSQRVMDVTSKKNVPNVKDMVWTVFPNDKDRKSVV